ncbi:MAG: ABC transporter permease [Rhizobacter sp.]|nr:ABC transporter permease [Ferruginibacter sp.]
MIKNYFKIAWRNLFRFKRYAFVNITGLVVGLTGFIIVLLYLNYELSYDKWDKSLERVYKISVRTDEDILQTTPAPLAELLVQKIPFIQSATTMQSSGDFEVLLNTGEKKIFQKGGVEADSTFLQVFPYKITGGDPLTALNKPNAIIISEDVAKKLYGHLNVIGKTIKIHNAFDNEITAIFRQPLSPSHFNTSFVYRSPYEKSNNHWENISYQTYVNTAGKVPVSKLESAANEVYYNHQLKEDNVSLEAFRKSGHQAGIFADRVQDIHNFPKHGPSNFTTVTVLLLLAILLLLSGAINFSNLSIAASMRRAKEVGVRKVLGSGIGQIRWQFMSEIALQCFISLCGSILLVGLLLPYFNNMFALDLHFFEAGNALSICLQIIGCLFIVILLSGLYPAFFLSRYNITKVLKGDYTRGGKGTDFKNALIVVQFTVATFFITGTLIIRNQMRFMQEKDKGFNSSQVMRLEAPQRIRDKNFDVTRSRLLAVPGVELVSKTTMVPGDAFNDTSTMAFMYAGQPHRMNSVKISPDYFSTLNIQLSKGRLFDDRTADAHCMSAIINETGAKQLNIRQPGGEHIYFPGCDSLPVQVVGIVKDFNTQSFESAVKPVVFTMGNNNCLMQSGGGILVKLNGADLKAAVAGVETVWNNIEPNMPIRYSFLDDNFQKLFASNIRVQKMISLFSLSAIIISLLGLFALTSFLINQRTKEIGIRKILGARLADVGLLVSKDFIKLILVAVVIAMPLAWLATDKWLQTFYYRINNNLWTFFLAAALILLPAITTILLLAVKAARSNPAKSLRTE